MDLLFVGEKGGGKTLTAVRTIVEALVAERHVTSNIVLHWDKIDPYTQFRYGVTIDRNFFHFLSTKEEVFNSHRLVVRGESEKHPSLLVLEELYKYYPARAWAENAKRSQEFLEWLVEARHYCVDCIFIIQAVKMLDAMLVRQVSQVWKFHDWRTIKIPLFWGLGGKIGFKWHSVTVSLFYPSDLQHSFGKEIFLVDKRLYGLYDTHAIAGEAKKMLEPATMARNTINRAHLERRRRRVLAMAALLPVAVLVGCARSEKREYRKMTVEMKEAKQTYLEAALHLQTLAVARDVRKVLPSGVVPPVPVAAASDLPAGVVPVRVAAADSDGVARAVKTAVVMPRAVSVVGWYDDDTGFHYHLEGGFTLAVGDWWEDAKGYLVTGSEKLAVVRRADGQVYGLSVLRVEAKGEVAGMD